MCTIGRCSCTPLGLCSSSELMKNLCGASVARAGDGEPGLLGSLPNSLTNSLRDLGCHSLSLWFSYPVCKMGMMRAFSWQVGIVQGYKSSCFLESSCCITLCPEPFPANKSFPLICPGVFVSLCVLYKTEHPGISLASLEWGGGIFCHMGQERWEGDRPISQARPLAALVRFLSCSSSVLDPHAANLPPLAGMTTSLPRMVSLHFHSLPDCLRSGSLQAPASLSPLLANQAPPRARGGLPGCSGSPSLARPHFAFTERLGERSGHSY